MRPAPCSTNSTTASRGSAGISQDGLGVAAVTNTSQMSVVHINKGSPHHDACSARIRSSLALRSSLLAPGQWSSQSRGTLLTEALNAVA